jgi:hypothetical protein
MSAPDRRAMLDRGYPMGFIDRTRLLRAFEFYCAHDGR